jgi:hypothetical protein
LGQVIHHSVYVEGLPECSIEFDSEEPKRRTRRPVIEAAICCDPVSGMLDIVSKGGRPLREEIAQSFAARLADSENALTPARPRDFDLDHLKRPMAFPTDPSDGIKSVEVMLLRLRNAAGHFGRVTIEVDGEHPDIYRTSAGWFGDFDPLRRPEWRVMQARLRIAFYAEGRGKRGKSITVELALAAVPVGFLLYAIAYGAEATAFHYWFFHPIMNPAGWGAFGAFMGILWHAISQLDKNSN